MDVKEMVLAAGVFVTLVLGLWNLWANLRTESPRVSWRLVGLS